MSRSPYRDRQTNEQHPQNPERRYYCRTRQGGLNTSKTWRKHGSENCRRSCFGNDIGGGESAQGQNEPCHSNRGHGRSTSASGPAGPAVRASASGQIRTHAVQRDLGHPSSVLWWHTPGLGTLRTGENLNPQSSLISRVFTTWPTRLISSLSTRSNSSGPPPLGSTPRIAS